MGAIITLQMPHKDCAIGFVDDVTKRGHAQPTGLANQVKRVRHLSPSSAPAIRKVAKRVRPAVFPADRRDPGWLSSFAPPDSPAGPEAKAGA
ncbi:MAG: hypothetical protein EA383_15760 [Spirochaetaceae bacterium]|nr:MAG: hypothetical protein EA383_15760 [Spirochaetaceae bacterium]